MPKKWRKLEPIDLSPRASSDAMASSPEEIASPDPMASPEHVSPSEESIGSGYPIPPVSPDRPEEALPYLWLMDQFLLPVPLQVQCHRRYLHNLWGRIWRRLRRHMGLRLFTNFWYRKGGGLHLSLYRRSWCLWILQC